MSSLAWLVFGLVLGLAGGLVLSHKPVNSLSPTLDSPPVCTAVQTPLPPVAPVSQAKVQVGETIIAMPEPLAVVLGHLSLVELKEECTKAEGAWLHNHYDGFAKAATSLSERQQLLNQLNGSIKKSSWWHGRMAMSNGENIMHIDFMLKFYSNHERADTFKNNSLPEPLGPDDLCFSLNVFVELSGKIENSPISLCGSADQKHGSAFYIRYNPYSNSKVLAQIASILLIPFPGNRVPLEYLATSTGEWIHQADFVWEPATYEEWQQLHERFLKSE